MYLFSKAVVAVTIFNQFLGLATKKIVNKLYSSYLHKCFFFSTPIKIHTYLFLIEMVKYINIV